MEKTYEYRIYPNKVQQVLLQKTFGCVRFVYNHYLALRKDTPLTYFACSKDLTRLKGRFHRPSKYVKAFGPGVSKLLSETGRLSHV